MNSRLRLFVVFLLAVVMAAGGCSTAPVAPSRATVTTPTSGSVLRSVTMDRALEDRILALDPAKISAKDVRDTLSKAPAPRMLWSFAEGEDGWVVLAFEEIDGQPPAQPWVNEDLDRVIAALIELSAVLTPSPMGARLRSPPPCSAPRGPRRAARRHTSTGDYRWMGRALS